MCYVKDDLALSIDVSLQYLQLYYLFQSPSQSLLAYRFPFETAFDVFPSCCSAAGASLNIL